MTISTARFIKNEAGTTILLFGLLVFPILGFIGGAIDFGRSYMIRTQIQAALDSAILAGAVTNSKKKREIIKSARKAFKANYEKSFPNIKVKTSFKVDFNDKISGTASARVPNFFLGLLQKPYFDVGVTAEAKMATKLEAEIVFVLDYSGSMNSNGKYQAMRDAANQLIDDVSENGKNEKVKFGLVPFSKQIYASMPSDFIVNERPGSTWTNCTMDRKYPYNTTDFSPLSGNDDTKWGQTCSGHGRCNPYGECGQYPRKNLVLQPLTNNHSDVKRQLQAMQPHGWTHISLGLSFGWHVVSPNAPWTEGKPYGSEDLLKAIVLLTDGRQTSDGWGPGYSRSVPNGEDNLEELCRGIKDRKILMVTVAFDLRDEATKERLEQCATSKAYFFDADNNAELAAAFQAISKQFIRFTHISR